MNQPFQKIAFLFFIGFGVFYLSADFLINQAGTSSSATLILIYETFDMPFFFSAGMYALATIKMKIEKYAPIPFLSPIFWALAVIFTAFLLYINLDFSTFF